jgi:hypothetical protein
MVKDSAREEEESEDNEEEESYRKARGDWRNDAMTDRQRDYIFALGGSIHAGATKGEASDAIEALLGQRPPTSRQQMVLRFWGRSREAGEGPGEISDWQDRFYSEDPDRKHAWELFKEESNDDGRQGDPNRVPFGVGPEYLARIKRSPKTPRNEPAPAGSGSSAELTAPKKNFEAPKEKKSYVGIVAVGFTVMLVIVGFLAARTPSRRLSTADTRPESAAKESPAQPTEALKLGTVSTIPTREIHEKENRAALESTSARRVAALKVTGLIGGSRPRVLIDGKLYAAGEIVDSANGLSVQSIDMRESSVLFVDGSGISYTRSLG